MNKLIIIGPFEEFHAFGKYNAFLGYLRDMGVDTVAVVPEKALGAISEASEIITISNDYLNSKGSNYPQVLDIMSNRNLSDFHTKAIEYCKNKYPDCQVIFWNWDYLRTEDTLTDVDFEDGFVIPSFNCNGNLTKSFVRDLNLIRRWLLQEKLLYPTEAAMQKIKSLYGRILEPNTYILITRNYKNKQPDTNTLAMWPQTIDFIKFMSNKEINIINIGFPPAHINIPSIHYFEIDGSHLNHDDVMAFYQLVDGVFLYGENGAFMLHYMCNANIFLLAEEWSVLTQNISIFDAKTNPTVRSIKFVEQFKRGDYQSILNDIMSNKVQVNQTQFTDIPTHFIDK